MYQIFKCSMNQTVNFAAEELKKYLRMLMPNSGDIPVKYCAEANEGFRIGLMSDFGLDTSDAEDILLDDVIYIETDENGGIIAGSNPVATLIAVYRYLRFLGCRWLFPGIDGEWIPMIEKLIPVNYRKLADYRYRGQCNEGAEYQQNMIEVIDFVPKIGLNTFMIEFDNPYTYYNDYYAHTNSKTREPEPIHRDTALQWKRQCEVELQKRGIHMHDMGHGWTAEPFGLDSSAGWTAIPGAEEAVPDETRQYLAMINGERKLFRGAPMLTNVCMSNPKVRKIMVDYIADYAEMHSNVDNLKISLADSRHSQCECEECSKKLPADWYVMLLNELDEELTRRNLDTHLGFSAYANTFWAPLQERLKNNKRFTMTFAPIWRLYTETYAEEADMSKLEPFVRNDLILPHGMAETLAYLRKWQEIWTGDVITYEYHFMDFQYNDPTNMYISKLLYDDVRALKKQGIHGMIEDGSQRSYFPTGFPYYVYGETLFDSSVTFEELKEDYFSHAYGENWKKVVEYLEKLRDCLEFSYFFRYVGEKPKYEGKGFFYDPDMAPKAARVHDIVKDFAPVIRENTGQYYRASTVSWQLLEIFNHAVDKMATIVEYKSVGKDAEAVEPIVSLIQYMSEREIYIERYFDLYLFAAVWESVAEGMLEQQGINNLTV